MVPQVSHFRIFSAPLRSLNSSMPVRVDKAGRPYIEHPKRVMAAVSNDAERIVAILHDVIEDSDVTLDQLAAEGFPAYILDALDS